MGSTLPTRPLIDHGRGARRLRRSTAGSAASSRTPASADDLLLAPNIWGGFHLLRPGPAIGIVGDYAAAAERLSDLIDLGVDAFILAGVPHLEEAYRVGTEVLPLVRGRADDRALRFAV